VADLTSTTDNGVPSGADNFSRAEPDLEPYAFQKSYRFWMVLITLSFTILLTSLEGTVVITSLPFIVSDLAIGSNYVWVSNVFLLSRSDPTPTAWNVAKSDSPCTISAAVQPLFGQFSDLFGRKAVLLASLALYMFGSGLAGGANTEEMLLGGRVVQGVGSGGLNTVAGIIVADLVPLRYRGIYESLLLMITTIGFSIGPFVGGALVEHSTWRWVREATCI
jgi:MFS family permease